MDGYWESTLQSIPDEFFISQDRSYTVLSVTRPGPGDKTSLFTRESIPRPSLCQWAHDVGHETAIGSHAVVLRCLIVSTHKHNDYPIDISRQDLSSVARSFGIAAGHVPLLFSPFTGCATIDREVSWYFGRPGLRALAHTDSKTRCTNAVVAIEESSQSEFEEDICRMASFAQHPLMLVGAIRANTLKTSGQLFRDFVQSLRHSERLTGFGIDQDDESDSEQTPVSTQSPLAIDLGKISRRVASDGSNMGNFKILLAKLQSVQNMLHSDDLPLKWAMHFDGQLRHDYEQQSNDMLETDSVLEVTRKGLLESIAEYQNRARSLQSVIFNLIAKTDADANIALARESSLIAAESRAIAQATRKDGNSMKTIAIMTMVFLPGTFFSSLFAVPTLQWGQSPVIQSNFWVYWAFTIPATILVLLAWLIWVHMIAREESVQQKQHELNRGKLWTVHRSLAPRSSAQHDTKTAGAPAMTNNFSHFKTGASVAMSSASADNTVIRNRHQNGTYNQSESLSGGKRGEMTPNSKPGDDEGSHIEQMA